MFDLAHKHADGEDFINASNGIYKLHRANKTDPSSSVKKTRKCRGEFVANTKKHGSKKQKQGHGNRGKFDEIMNSPC